MTSTHKLRRKALASSGLAIALLVLLYWTDFTGGYFAALDEAETNKNCFCEVRFESGSYIKIYQIYI